jgi:hypothetical protein
MQLPATALLGNSPEEQQQQQQDQLDGLSPEEQQRRRRTQQLQPNSPPHMAIMETVVSTQLSHPHVVQVSYGAETLQTILQMMMQGWKM